MKGKKFSSIIIPACLLTTTLLFASGAFAAVTENECINSGGYITQGTGCKFCVGGKFDMSEIKDSGKKAPPRADSGKKSGDPVSTTNGKNAGGN